MVEIAIIAGLALLYFVGESRKAVAGAQAQGVTTAKTGGATTSCFSKLRNIPAKILVQPAPGSIPNSCQQVGVDSCCSPWFQQDAVWYITANGTRRWVANAPLAIHVFGDGDSSKFQGAINHSYTWAEIMAYPRGADYGVPLPTTKVG
jgi:hypothetical protein